MQKGNWREFGAKVLKNFFEIFCLPILVMMASLPKFYFKQPRFIASNNFPQFNWSELSDKDVISQGAFGVVFTAQY